MAAVTFRSDFGAQENKICHCFHFFPFRKVMGQDAMILISIWIKCKLLFEGAMVTVWRRQWHPTPVLLPGKSHGWRSLVGCSPWGC